MLQETKPYSNRKTVIPGRLEIHAADDAARFSLRIAPEKLSSAEKALGAKIPVKIGALVRTGDIAVACLGPDEWYIWADESKAVAVVEAFAKLYESEPHSLVDVSHRETGIDITGPQAEWLLNAASPLNLAEMSAPGAARTIFDHAQIILMKWDAEHYRIEVWNSFADHVWTLLELASNEVELAI
ncbi:sarcosine oxidase subunit gamma [Ochrobactrum daejeonense]|uniref:Sarcosine oxidase subunit gamma n=1 Tax=Brucella daejeonensis TaxID=659015 RepID=A0A7W9AXR4_9HYPH|nr:sarcosine oxidase subunit gamma [Brucella daejeonensis]MBB5702461.1 sarcosine oxidase subunit gamma [Brucella daejeonensis]NKB78595.1 sarcosine oxidase subunit gamma [Brucella daejeonensis]